MKFWQTGQNQSWFHEHETPVWLQRTLCLEVPCSGSILCCYHVDIVLTWTRDPTFLFHTGPCNYVDSSFQMPIIFVIVIFPTLVKELQPIKTLWIHHPLLVFQPLYCKNSTIKIRSYKSYCCSETLTKADFSSLSPSLDLTVSFLGLQVVSSNCLAGRG